MMRILIIKNGFNLPLTGFRKTGRQNWMKCIKKESWCKHLKQQRNGLPCYNSGERKLSQQNKKPASIAAGSFLSKKQNIIMTECAYIWIINFYGNTQRPSACRIDRCR